MDLAEEKINSVPTVANSIYILKTAHLTHTVCLWKGWRWTGGLAGLEWPYISFQKFIIRLLSTSQVVNISINNCDCEGQSLPRNLFFSAEAEQLVDQAGTLTSLNGRDGFAITGDP